MMNQEGMIINFLNRDLKINYLIVIDWFLMNEKIVNIFEELLKSIPKEIREENKRFDSKI